MNKKIFAIILVIFSFFVFKDKINAVVPECRLFSEKDCDPLPVMDSSGNITGGNSNCKWDSNLKQCIGKSERTSSCENFTNLQSAESFCELQAGCKWSQNILSTGECVEEKCDKNDEADCKNSKNCMWDDINRKCVTFNSNNSSLYISCENLSQTTCNDIKVCTWKDDKCIKEIDCNKLNKNECAIIKSCKWNDSSYECQDNYVLENGCNEASVKKVLRLFGYLIQLLRLAVPLIIIIMGTFDVYEAVIDKDEKLLSKKIKQLGIRIVGGIFIFFIPTILNAIFVLSDKLNIMSTSEYQACETCLLKPSKCIIKKDNSQENNNNNQTNIIKHQDIKLKMDICNEKTVSSDNATYNALKCVKEGMEEGCNWSSNLGICYYKLPFNSKEEFQKFCKDLNSTECNIYNANGCFWDNYMEKCYYNNLYYNQ